MIEEFVPGIKRGQASTAMSIGGFLGAPGESAYDELQPIFDQGKPLQPWNPFSKRVPYTEEEKKELAEKYVKSGVLDRRKGAFDRPRQPEFLENIGESLYDAGKQYREQINEGIETRAPTEEEYIEQKKKGGPIDQLLAKGVESGYLPVPQQLSRSFGESTSSQLVPATVGGLTALTGLATKSPAMVGAGTGIYRAGSLVAGATQVAGSIGDAIQSDDDIRQLVQEKVESKYDPETIGNPKVQRKIKREVDKEMKRHGMDMASRAVGDRIFSPQALLDYASTYPGGGLLTKFLIDIGAEAGSEGFDTMLEQTMKLNKMEELMRELGYTPEQIEERLTYDTIGGYRVSDWKEVKKGGISGALMEGPVATIEAGVERVVYGKQDKRVERGTQNDRDMQLLKDQAYAQQVQLQERNIVQEGINKETDLEIQREKTEQLRLKNQTGDTAPAVEPILDQDEVQSVYDEANQDTPIAEEFTPNLAPIEQPTMSPQEQADVQALDDQMLNPDVINPLSPEQVAESQQQRTQEIRQNELDLDAQDTLGVNPEDIAPVGPDQTQQKNYRRHERNCQTQCVSVLSYRIITFKTGKRLKSAGVRLKPQNKEPLSEV